nr:hypothetical protein CFP56_32863 [Quercus suber]
MHCFTGTPLSLSLHWKSTYRHGSLLVVVAHPSSQIVDRSSASAPVLCARCSLWPSLKIADRRSPIALPLLRPPIALPLLRSLALPQGDSEVIFKFLTTDQPCLTAFGHIIEESRSLAARLRMVFFIHTKCKGNNVADKLAKLAKNLYDPQVWLEDIHRNVTDLVTFDRSFLHS